MEKRELTCIQCPMGCQITVELENGEVRNISGYTCNRGKVYAGKEVTNPTRVVTSSVKVTGSPSEKMVSVRTASDVPKDKVFDCVKALAGVTVKAPVRIGDVIVRDVAGTGVDVIATRNA